MSDSPLPSSALPLCVQRTQRLCHHLQAQAFAVSEERAQVEPYARAVARAVLNGGSSARTAYGLALAQAIAGEGAAE